MTDYRAFHRFNHAIARCLHGAVWMLLCLPGLMFLDAAALPVTGLYSHQVPVSGQSEAERTRAYREGLSQVIVKVTGEQRWLEQPRVSQALGNASDFVAEVSYRSQGGQLVLDVQFDQSQLDALLNQENIPVWDNNRASILLWITVQTADGRRTMLGSSSEHELLEQARVFANERAVPILIPLLDLTDRALVPPVQAWALEPAALQQAADRYAADSVLAGRLMETSDGQWVGLWRFMFRGSDDVFDHLEPQSGVYMNMPLDRATSQLARHFGLVLSQLDQRDEVILQVSGIDDLASNLQLQQYLESLSVVRAVRLTALRQGSVDLHLELAGNRQILTEFISLGRDLQAVDFTPGAVVAERLHYRWTR